MPRELAAALGFLVFAAAAHGQSSVTATAVVTEQVSASAPQLQAAGNGSELQLRREQAGGPGTSLLELVRWTVVPREAAGTAPVRQAGSLEQRTVRTVVAGDAGETLPTGGTLPWPGQDEVLVVTRVVAANS